MNAAIANVPLTTPRDYTREILRQVAAEHGVTVRQLLSKTRTHRVAHARFVAIRRLLEVKPNWSISDVARMFRMDHTSALHALDHIGAGRLGRKRGVYPRYAPIQNAGTQQTEAHRGEEVSVQA